MESVSDPRDQLRAADRAEASAWVDFPPTPSWYPPAVGTWAAVLALGIAGLPQWWGILAIVLAGVADVAWLRWYRRYRGAMPASGMPEELRRPAATLVVILVGTTALVGVAIVAAPVWVAPLLALMVLTPAIWWYERAYADAMARTRARLA